MKHESIQELLVGYYDGKLAESERATVAAHLDSCKECASILADWTKLGKAFFRPPEAPTRAQTELFVKAVMDRIEGYETHVFVPMRWLVPAMGLVAVSIMIAISPPLPETGDGSEILTGVAGGSPSFSLED